MMEDFNKLQAEISSALVSITRSTASLASEDIAFHRSLDSALGPALDKQNARLLGLTERLLGAATANTETVRPPRLRDLESVDGNWKAVVDVVDSLLERADTALDEFTGAVRRLSPGVDQTATNFQHRPSRTATALKSQDLRKPQLDFEFVPNNADTEPFKPLLLSKPHAAKPLETEPVSMASGDSPAYPHPYQTEIEQYRYPSTVYTYAEPVKSHPFDTTTATLVDSEDALHEMLQELKQASEIAVDLEHHDARSYIGIVCLMQISTRDKDWIVDTLKPWRRKLQCLNEVFANPNILKVLHGAYMDIVWLQRDLGLYVVGLFDTYYAARALGYPGASLAYLLKRFVNFDAQKQFQTADWRIRPLPQELFDYARSDTHYLLYVFDCMRNELIERSDFSIADHEQDRIWSVLEKSIETALQRYEHPVYDAEDGQGTGGWYKMISRTPAPFSKEQFAVFRAVHKWRDDVAREQDDSVHYVLPNHHIFSVAREMPMKRAELFGIVQPTTQTVRLRADELLNTVARAKESARDAPEMREILHRIDVRFPRKGMLRTQNTALPAPASASTGLVLPSANGLQTAFGLPIRSSTSSFWGSAFESSVWNQKRPMSTVDNVSLSVPLPPLTAEIFTRASEETPAKVPQQQMSDVVPTPQPTGTEQDDEDVFILKDLYKKRKYEDPLDAMATQSDEVALDVEQDVKRAEREAKAERKKVKKAAKHAAKSGADTMSTNSGTPGGTADEQAFDYAAGPSILHPPQDSTMSAKERRQREKQMNPYSKSMDTAKSLPRVQKERAGRSMTYRS